MGLLNCRAASDPIATLDWNAPLDATPAPASPLPRLHTDGNALLAPDGTRVVLRGVNVCSLEFDRDGANWELTDQGSDVLRVLAERWGANVVRMPVNQEWFLTDEDYVLRVERLIDDANARGLYIVLDVQWEVGRKLDPYHANILELPTFGAGNTTEAFWHKAVSRLAKRTNVLYDLINEAHGFPEKETAAAMQTLIDAIRTRDQETVIVVSGMDWAHTLDYYRTHPLHGGNLVYSAHQYLPYDQPRTFPGKWARAAAELPVLLGEFLADDATYALAVVDAAEAASAVGWMPWALGCGFAKDDDLTKEPLITLAARMRSR